MRNILFISLFALCFAACKKDPEIKGTRDLKNLSLPQLKKFLDGKWRWQYTVLTNFGGFKDTIIATEDEYLIFYPIDSVRGENSQGEVFYPEKLHYEFIQLPWVGAPKVNVLMFAHDGFGYLNKWVADRLNNDTLFF